MSRFASFLVGMGGGYIKARDKEYERERQAKEDAWQQKERDRKEAEWTKADKLDSDLRMAGTPVAAEQPNDVLKDDDGNEMPAVPAFRAGTKRFTTMAEATQAAEAQNTPEAVNARVSSAYRSNGQPLQAINMDNAVMESKAKKLGLDAAQLKFVDELTRRQMSEALASGPTWHEGAAKFVTESQFKGIKDVKSESVVSPDGKTVTLFVTKPDGTREARGTYPADEKGALQFMEQFGQLPIETRMGLMQGRATAAADQANKDRDFDLRKLESENNQQYRNRMLRLQEAQDGRQAQAHRVAMEAEKLPAAVKLSAASLNKQIEAIGAALNKSMAEGQFDPNNPGTKQLLEQQAMLGIQYRTLVQPYMPGGKTATGDVLGLGGDEKPAAASTQSAAPAKPPVAPAKPEGAKPAPREIQLLQPLYDMNQWRRQMQERANEAN